MGGRARRKQRRAPPAATPPPSPLLPRMMTLLLAALARVDGAAGELAGRGGAGLSRLRGAVTDAASARSAGGDPGDAETQTLWDAAVKLWVS